MRRLQYTINILASAAKVYDTMLGISDKSTYEQWTAAFNPTSTYEGSWEKGSKIRFIGVDEQGEKGGMLSRIEDHVPNRFVSIQHYGILKGNDEITSGPEVDQWANGYENYTFDGGEGSTTVIVDLDTTEDFVDYMNGQYPKALEKLKEICER